MRPFNYCPADATILESPDSEGGALCPACGRTWYRNSAPTVGAAIVRDRRVLVAVRGIEPEKGKIDVPGGFLLPGEHPLVGLRREAAEELGVEIEVGFEDFLQAIPHRYGSEGDWVLSLGFAARIKDGSPRPADDVAELRWVTLEQLDEVEFAWPHDRDLARAALQNAQAG